VEYGLTDIQEYYANTGALKRAAETAQGGTHLIVCNSISIVYAKASMQRHQLYGTCSMSTACG
jgi:hypothetical protein